MRVCRLCGNAFMIRRIGGRNPMSSMRSASSSTTNSTPERLATRCSIKSIRRPGVATTRSTPERSASICGRSLTPPKTVATRNGTCFAYARTFSSIWTTSSRVGANTSARSRCTLCFCRDDSQLTRRGEQRSVSILRASSKSAERKRRSSPSQSARCR